MQGRGEAGDRCSPTRKALQHAGAFAVVLEVVPADLAAQVTAMLTIPTIGIGAGAGYDAQVLVWQDMAGPHAGPGREVREEVRRPARRSSPARSRDGRTTSAPARTPPPGAHLHADRAWLRRAA